MRISTTPLLALIFAGLAGCASGPQLYGNFLGRGSPQAQSFFALDSAAQLRRAFAPASMPLVLQDAHDPFGQALVSRLRRMGFAVAEDGQTPAPNALMLRYVVDGIERDLYRVTLVIWRARDEALLSRMSRAYGIQAGMVGPAGPWTRQVPVAQGDEAGGKSWTTN